MDKDTILNVMNGMVSGNRQLQARLVKEFLTEDVVFNHVAGAAKGRNQVYGK
jgi:hypothetical protein